MRFTRFVGLAVLALCTTSAAWAQDRVEDRNDSERPGSVLVFPKFITGRFTINGIQQPASSFEISVTCPEGQLCFEGQPVKLRAHWVCPGDRFRVCAERNFNLFTSVNGTLWFNPENVGTRAPAGITVANPPCPRGFLIVWVVDEFDRPIPFDGLIGDAILRHSAVSAAAYNAIPIQAAEPDTTGGGSLPDNALRFDGTQYKRLTNDVLAPVRFNTPRVTTNITLMTLDVDSNSPNPRIFADFNVFSHDENVLSASVNFVCWIEFSLAGLTPRDFGGTGSLKGLFETTNVTTSFQGRTFRPVILGIVETIETGAAGGGGGIVDEYAYNLFHKGPEVDTAFLP